MQVNSLGYRTDLIFPSFDGVILDRESYLVVRTPSNPTFYWGNYLLFSKPPAPGDNDHWLNLFEKEIGSPPDVRHQTLGWDTTDGERGDIGPFLEDGFRVQESVVLTASSFAEPRNPTRSIEVRPLSDDTSWNQAFENQVRCRDPEHEEAHYREFKSVHMSRYRRMTESGLGSWYGAFLGEELVADLGIFHEGGIGRFQTVETHPEFRRQGIASYLVYHAAVHAKEMFSLNNLVIVADRGSSAERLYSRLGFQSTEIQLGMEKW